MPLATDTPPNALQACPVPHSELQATIEAALLAGADGRLSRGAEMFLATVCAEVIADRLEAAGLGVMRRTDER